MNASRIPLLRKIKSLVLLTTGGSAAFAVIGLYSGNSKFYNNVVMPILHTIEPENAHRFAVVATSFGLVPKCKQKDSELLETSLWGLKFDNPIGLAAGFDKDCETLPGIFKIGFGFVEIGSVTPKSQPGNPKPRIFRLENDEGIINRCGFNNDGHDNVYNRLKKTKEKRCNHIVGVNLGKNKDSPSAVEDYVEGVKKFGEIADYLVINISSPNTPGLRSLQKYKLLEELLDNVFEARNTISCKPPLFVKLSPDMSYSEKQDVAKVVRRKGKEVDGLIVSNTTIKRPDNLVDSGKEDGGLSGKPLKQIATSTIEDMFLLTKGEIPIIGVGGVFTGKDAYEKIKAGASLIQLYTAIIYRGPPVIGEIKKELEDLLKADGYSNIKEAVGVNHRVKK